MMTYKYRNMTRLFQHLNIYLIKIFVNIGHIRKSVYKQFETDLLFA